MPAKISITTVNNDKLSLEQFNSLCDNQLSKVPRINNFITMLEKAKDKKKLINDFYLRAFLPGDKNIELKQAIKDLLIPNTADEAQSILILLRLLIDTRSSHTTNLYQLDFVKAIANHIAEHVIQASYLDLFASRFLKLVVDRTNSRKNKQYFNAIFPLIAKSEKVATSLLSPSLLSRVFNRHRRIENLITPTQLINLVENNPTKDFIKTFIEKRPSWDFLGLFYKGYGELFSLKDWEALLTSPKLITVRTELLHAAKTYCSESLYLKLQAKASASKMFIKHDSYNTVLSSISLKMDNAIAQAESQEENEIKSTSPNQEQTKIAQKERRRSFSAPAFYLPYEEGDENDTTTNDFPANLSI